MASSDGTVRRRRHQAVHVPRLLGTCTGRTADQNQNPCLLVSVDTVPRGIQQGSFYRSGEASTTTSDDDDDEDDDEFDLDEGDEPDAATIDRSGNAAANRLEAVVARIARRESETRE